MFLIDGASIQDTNNQNFGNVDDEKINSMLAEANKKDISEAAPEYAAVDKQLVDQRATSCPYGHRKLHVHHVGPDGLRQPPCSTRCCRPCTRRSPSRASDVTDGRGTRRVAPPAPPRRLDNQQQGPGGLV